MGSKAVGQPKCCDADKTLDKSCEPTTTENKKFREHQDQRRERRKRKTKKHPNGKPTHATRDMTWKDKHCGNLLFDMNQSPEEIGKSLEKIEEEFKDLKGDFVEQAKEIASGAIEDKLLKVAGVMGCEAIGAAIGGVIGFFFGAGVGAAPGAVLGATAGGAICGTAAVIDTAIGIPDLWTSADWVKDQIKNTKQALKNLNEYQGTIKDIANIKNGPLSAEEKTAAIAKIKEPLLARQEAEVNARPCLKSKRCEMSPYAKSTKSVYPHGKGKDKSPMDTLLKLDQPDGCCPGQQAHHVIPSGKFDGCSDYTVVKDKFRKIDGKEVLVKKGQGANSVEAKAPTICLEGGNNNGTHGKLHKKTDVNTEDMLNGEYNKNPSSMKSTIEASAEAMNETFGCDKECVAQELKKFYKDLCKDKISLKNRNGDVIEKDGSSTEREGL